METKDNNPNTEFHAVEYMRQIREKRSQEYLDDREKYLESARQAMADFKLRLAKANQKQSLVESEVEKAD